MRLTRRGWFVLLVVAAAIVSGALFGPRGLNAVAAPGAVALIAAAVQVARVDRPRIDRVIPAAGTQGDRIDVLLRFGADPPVGAIVWDAVDEGLASVADRRGITVSEPTVPYGLDLEDRGEHTVGPATVEARDVLGLVAARFDYSRTDAILVRPRPRRLRGPRVLDLARLHGGVDDDRAEFEQLRSYRRGDSVRDIHWKTSAKRPDGELVVKQFVSTERSTEVELAATATPGAADGMAVAVASIAVFLLEAGARVGLTTGSGRIPPAEGPDHRDRLLDHLARVEGAPLPGHAIERADVVVTASAEGTEVDLGPIACPFDDLATDHDTPVDSARHGGEAATP